MDRICIFARVSTNVQDYERQVNELTALAQRNSWRVEAVFCEKISGAKKNTERKELGRMVEYVQAHNINKVAVLSIDRLGRDTLQALEVIELLNKLGISLYIKNYGIETLTESGEINPMSQFLCTLLLEVARMERRTIRERVESGYYVRASASATSAKSQVRASIQFASARASSKKSSSKIWKCEIFSISLH